jgi:hypothetical protein
MRQSCVDAWTGARPEDIVELEVSLDDVPAEAFRMFENHKFGFARKTRKEG